MQSFESIKNECKSNALQNAIREVFTIDVNLLLSDFFHRKRLGIAVILWRRLGSYWKTRRETNGSKLTINLGKHSYVCGKAEDFFNFFLSKLTSFGALFRFKLWLISMFGFVKWVIGVIEFIVEFVVLFDGWEANEEENIDAKSDGFSGLFSLFVDETGGVGLTDGPVGGDADADPDEPFDFFFFLWVVLSIIGLSTEESAIIGEEWLDFVDMTASSALFSILTFDSNLKACDPWLELECIEEGEAIDALDDILPVFAVFFFGCLLSVAVKCCTKSWREGENFSGLDSGVALSLGMGLNAGIGLIFPPSFFWHTIL